MSLGLVVLEKKFVTRTRTQTRTPQSDAIKSADIKMVSVKCLVETVKVMFVKRLCNGVDAKWKVLAQELMGIHLNNICERRLLQSIKQNIKTDFYKTDLLTTWFHF